MDISYRLAHTIAQRAPHARVILFGSRARGTHSPFADIDLAIEGVTDDAQWLALQRLTDIDDAQAFPTLHKIDLIRLEEADAPLRESIEREGKILYER